MGGTVMVLRASGAPDNVNTRSIELFAMSFSLLVTWPPQKDDSGTPSTFINLTLTLGLLLHEGETETDFHTECRWPSMATGDGDGAPSGGHSPGLAVTSTKAKDSQTGLSYVRLLPHVTRGQRPRLIHSNDPGGGFATCSKLGYQRKL